MKLTVKNISDALKVLGGEKNVILQFWFQAFLTSIGNIDMSLHQNFIQTLHGWPDGMWFPCDILPISKFLKKCENAKAIMTFLVFSINWLIVRYMQLFSHFFNTVLFWITYLTCYIPYSSQSRGRVLLWFSHSM